MAGLELLSTKVRINIVVRVLTNLYEGIDALRMNLDMIRPVILRLRRAGYRLTIEANHVHYTEGLDKKLDDCNTR
jgi:hypothetical protein